MNWNLNSIVKGNFERVPLIEVHNLYTRNELKNSTEIPDPLLKEYNFIPANHPGNVSHGGVGLFHKTSLPDDLSFEESIVIELKFGRMKIFFTVLY